MIFRSSRHFFSSFCHLSASKSSKSCINPHHALSLTPPLVIHGIQNESAMWSTATYTMRLVVLRLRTPSHHSIFSTLNIDHKLPQTPLKTLCKLEKIKLNNFITSFLRRLFFPRSPLYLHVVSPPQCKHETYPKRATCTWFFKMS